MVSLHTFAMRVSTADGSLNCRIKRSFRLFLGFTLGFALSSRALLGIANLSSPKGLREEEEEREGGGDLKNGLQNKTGQRILF